MSKKIVKSRKFRFSIYGFLFALGLWFILNPNPRVEALPEVLSEQTIAGKEYSLLTANLGNYNHVRCRLSFNNSLCLQAVQERITENIEKLAPDIVFLQELNINNVCQRKIADRKGTICEDRDVIDQPREILGPDYSIACGGGDKIECFGVHRRVGRIIDCPLGGRCDNLTEINQASSVCQKLLQRSTIVKVKAELGDQRVDLINAHPTPFVFRCRNETIKTLFEKFVGEEPVLIAGDFNFDPWRDDGGGLNIWQQYVDIEPGKKLVYYLSGPSEHSPPHFTFLWKPRKRTYDHVLTNFSSGECRTLGVEDESERLDGGEGMDHLGVMCRVRI